MVVVLGSVLEGSQLGHVWEVLLCWPRRRQDREQPLEVVRENLGGDRTQRGGSGMGHASRVRHGGGPGAARQGGPTWL